MLRLYRVSVDCVTYMIVDDHDIENQKDLVRGGLAAIEEEITEDIQQSIDMGSVCVTPAKLKTAQEDGWLKSLPWDRRDSGTADNQVTVGDLLLADQFDKAGKEATYLHELAKKEVGDDEALTGALIGKFDMEYGTAKKLVRLWKLSKEALATRQ